MQPLWGKSRKLQNYLIWVLNLFKEAEIDWADGSALILAYAIYSLWGDLRASDYFIGFTYVFHYFDKNCEAWLES